jgi:hypothetical protein
MAPKFLQGKLTGRWLWSWSPKLARKTARLELLVAWVGQVMTHTTSLTNTHNCFATVPSKGRGMQSGGGYCGGAAGGHLGP